MNIKRDFPVSDPENSGIMARKPDSCGSRFGLHWDCTEMNSAFFGGAYTPNKDSLTAADKPRPFCACSSGVFPTCGYPTHSQEGKGTNHTLEHCLPWVHPTAPWPRSSTL